MPKSRVAKSRMFRESAPMKKKYLKYEGMKHLYPTLREWDAKYNLRSQHVMFLVFVYDLEFFTIDYVCDKLDRNKKSVYRDTVGPLFKKGYLYKHFDKLTPSTTREDHLFRNETKYNYRVRYALSQKGRLLVAKFYRSVSSGSTVAPTDSSEHPTI